MDWIHQHCHRPQQQHRWWSNLSQTHYPWVLPLLYNPFLTMCHKKMWVSHFLFCYLYNKVQFMFVCLSASALAIFMDRFWNQGYLWTPHDPGITRKIWYFKISKNFPSLSASSNPSGERGPPEAPLKRVIIKTSIYISIDQGPTLSLDRPLNTSTDPCLSFPYPATITFGLDCWSDFTLVIFE